MKKNFLITLLVIFSFTSCENTEDLTIQVKDSISKELPKKNLNLLGLETEIINLDLVTHMHAIHRQQTPVFWVYK